MSSASMTAPESGCRQSFGGHAMPPPEGDTHAAHLGTANGGTAGATVSAGAGAAGRGGAGAGLGGYGGHFPAKCWSVWLAPSIPLLTSADQRATSQSGGAR